MKALIALLALFIVACGGGDSSSGPTGPTTGPPVPPAQIAGGQLFTYGNAVAFLPSGIAQYQAAIVFLPGLRNPATGQDLDSRDLVRGTSGGRLQYLVFSGRESGGKESRTRARRGKRGAHWNNHPGRHPREL